MQLLNVIKRITHSIFHERDISFFTRALWPNNLYHCKKIQIQTQKQYSALGFIKLSRLTLGSSRSKICFKTITSKTIKIQKYEYKIYLLTQVSWQSLFSSGSLWSKWSIITIQPSTTSGTNCLVASLSYTSFLSTGTRISSQTNLSSRTRGTTYKWDSNRLESCILT